MRAATALIVCSFAAAIGGCGDVDAGDAHFPGTILYQDPNGSFEFRLLEPPWIPPFYYEPLQTTFSVVPPVDATITADPTILLKEALYSLQFWKVTGDPASAMAAVQGTIPGGASDIPSAAVLTYSGSSGFELAWQEMPEVFHRDAFLAGSGTPTIRLHFTARKAITDDNMVGQMINSFRAK
jgi:hypothetical protein